MKKSTILILLIVFLGSVLIVGIFGMKSVPYEQIVYVKEIKPTSVTTVSANAQTLEIKQNSKGEYYVMLPYEENLELLINYELTPADCTTKDVKVSMVYPDSDHPAVITDRNSVLFTRKGNVRLLYETKDSASGPKMYFWIYTYNPK